MVEDAFNHLLEILPQSTFRIDNNVSVVYPNWQPVLNGLYGTMRSIVEHVNMQVYRKVHPNHEKIRINTH